MMCAKIKKHMLSILEENILLPIKGVKKTHTKGGERERHISSTGLGSEGSGSRWHGITIINKRRRVC